MRFGFGMRPLLIGELSLKLLEIVGVANGRRELKRYIETV